MSLSAKTSLGAALVVLLAGAGAQARALEPVKGTEIVALAHCAFVFGLHQDIEPALLGDLKPRMAAALPRLKQRFAVLYDSVDAGDVDPLIKTEIEDLKARVGKLSNPDINAKAAAAFRPDLIACLDRATVLPDPPPAT